MPGNYVLVRNGVDLSRFRPAGDADRAAARALLGLEPAAPLAVCVGRVCRQKGQDTLLEAWPRVTARHPAATLAVVGDGDLLPALRRRAPAGVRFTGAVDDARPWYAAADVVVVRGRVRGPATPSCRAATSRSRCSPSWPWWPRWWASGGSPGGSRLLRRRRERHR